MNIGTIIDATVAGDSGRAALIVDERVISYGELGVAVEQCAARLADSGLAGERVAVIDVGSLLSIATMLGAARIGAAAALMNPALAPPELQGSRRTPGVPQSASLARRTLTASLKLACPKRSPPLTCPTTERRPRRRLAKTSTSATR